MNNSRLIAVIFFILIALTALVIRLVNVQLVKSEELQFYAQRQQTRIEKIVPERGMIYDRNMNLLAYNRNDVSFYVDLRMTTKKNRDSIAAKFSRAFGKSFDHYAALLGSKEKMVCIEKKVSGEKVHELKRLKINGLTFQDEPTRIYQYNNLASHILGYVNTGYLGTEGIEKTYETVLHGEEGRRLVIRDAHGKIVTIDETTQKPAIKGKNVILTIDKNIQLNLENELRLGKEKFGAQEVSGIVMDPHTGEILAMASINDFDPNNYSSFSDSIRRNKIVTDVFEPGSTFKAVALASFLDKGLCSLNESVFLENGTYQFKRIKIKDSHKAGNSTVRGIFANSSNIGMSKLSQRIDNEDFYIYLRSFGLGNLTNIDLPGEVKGNLKKPNTWTDYTKSSISFGYEIAVTSIQLAAIYASLINGGVLYQPILVKSLENSENGTVEESEPIEIRRVISEETSQKMRSLFKEVVETGTGKKAIVEGVSVGGKTGTSRQIIDGSYSLEKYNSSFIGFFPVENPKYLILVVANSPTINSYYGGDVAAPIFKNIAEKIISDDEVLFKEKLDKTGKSNGQVGMLQFADAKIIADSLAKTKTAPNIKTRKDFARLNTKKMPDLRGLSMREAIYLMSKLKIKYQISGNGRIDTQSINPGSKINSKTVCKLTCSTPELFGAKLY